jgi:hypothetical protein
LSSELDFPSRHRKKIRKKRKEKRGRKEKEKEKKGENSIFIKIWSFVP